MAAGVYIHVPFCKSRCSYCDFATDVYRDAAWVDRYVDALIAEISASDSIPGTIDSVYFGGGTPSLLSATQVSTIVEAIGSRFSLTSDLEFTLEMNPATVTPEKLAGFRAAGVNRASFGVQTFNDRDLKLLARGHDAHDARTTYDLLRTAGFENVSFDLIAGLPGQTLADWESNLNEAMRLGPDHISLYLLEIHEGTPLAEQLRTNRRPMPDEDLAATMYERMLDLTSSNGLAQYEISNFARPGRESRHNSKYWTLEPVLGFGVSAHSFDGRERYANVRDTNEYVKAIERGASTESFRELVDEAAEYVFLGLRLTAGIDLGDYHRRFGRDLAIERSDALASLAENGLVEIASGRLRLTRRGMLFSNEVFAEFV